MSGGNKGFLNQNKFKAGKSVKQQSKLRVPEAKVKSKYEPKSVGK
jgi:hypothetical protein